MPRSHRARRGGRSARSPEGGEERPIEAMLAGMPRVVSDAGGDWIVREVRGNASGKTYRCPGCDQEIPASLAHVVAWPAESAFGGDILEARRHWHGACWRARGRRAPTRRR